MPPRPRRTPLPLRHGSRGRGDHGHRRATGGSRGDESKLLRERERRDRDEKVTPEQEDRATPGVKMRSYTCRTSTGATAACDNPPRDESRPQSHLESHPQSHLSLSNPVTLLAEPDTYDPPPRSGSGSGKKPGVPPPLAFRGLGRLVWSHSPPGPSGSLRLQFSRGEARREAPARPTTLPADDSLTVLSRSRPSPVPHARPHSPAPRSSPATSPRRPWCRCSSNGEGALLRGHPRRTGAPRA